MNLISPAILSRSGAKKRYLGVPATSVVRDLAAPGWRWSVCRAGRVPPSFSSSNVSWIGKKVTGHYGVMTYCDYMTIWLYECHEMARSCMLFAPCSVVFASNRSWNDRFWELGNMNFSRSKPSRYARTSIWGDAASGCSCIVWDRVTKEEDVKMDQDASDDFDGSYISQLKNFKETTYKKTIHSSCSS